jgi:hypothetical protein
MQVTQISVFLENKSGRLADVCSLLGQQNINIRALSIADTTDFGILRLIVNKPPEAVKILREDSFTVSETEVIAVAVPDSPGGLAGVLVSLAQGKINLEYMYAFLGQKSNHALVIFRVDDIPGALRVLGESGVKVLPSDEVYAL